MASLGRNDPCPCGSGKKYKRCHLAEDEQTKPLAVEGVDAVEEENDFFDGPEVLNEDNPFAALADLEDERYWGRDSSDRQICMVYQAVEEHVADLARQAGRPLSVGDWLISTGVHEATVIHGPFRELDDALDYAHTQLGAVRFTSGLQFG